jgi:hypothetical protein
MIAETWESKNIVNSATLNTLRFWSPTFEKYLSFRSGGGRCGGQVLRRGVTERCASPGMQKVREALRHYSYVVRVPDHQYRA